MTARKMKTLFTILLVLPFSLAFAQGGQVVTGEWFWDSDPGEGNGTTVMASDGAFDDAIEDLLETSSNIPSLGAHTFHVRIQGVDGNWGPVFSTAIDTREPHANVRSVNVSLAEFFWDTDPGAGSGTAMLASDGSFDDAVEAITASSGNIPQGQGVHVLYVRAQEAGGAWGPTFATVVDVWDELASARAGLVKSAEYFFDVDPGEGNATPILAQDGNFNQSLEAIVGGGIPSPVALGVHVLYIRPMDEENVWGRTFGIVVNMDTTIGAPPFNTMMTGDDQVCEGGQGTHIYTATQHSGTSFQWNVEGGTIVNGDGTNQVEVQWDGPPPFSIEVVECDIANDCDSMEFFVDELENFFTQEAVHVAFADSAFLEGAWQTVAGTYYDTLVAVNGCDSIIETDLTIGAVGIVGNQQSMRVWPNPAGSGQQILAEFSNALHEPEVFVLDMTGRVVYHKQFASTQLLELQLEVATGLYHLRIQAGEETYSQELIIQ